MVMIKTGKGRENKEAEIGTVTGEKAHEADKINIEHVQNSDICISYKNKLRENRVTGASLFEGVQILCSGKNLLGATLKRALIATYGNVLIVKQWEFKHSESNMIAIIDKRAAKLLLTVSGKHQQLNIAKVQYKTGTYILVKLLDSVERLEEQYGVNTYSTIVRHKRTDNKETSGQVLVNIDTCEVIYKSLEVVE